MNRLKPCPFCGSEDIYETYSQEYSLGTKNPEIFCNSCKAIFSIEDDSPYMNCDEDFTYRRQKTTEAWNRRANDARPVKEGENITENNPVDEFVCSECGIILENWLRVEIDENDGERTYHEYVFRFCPNCGAKSGGANDG